MELIKISFAEMRKGEQMTDIGDICDFCIDGGRDCMMCPLGNPCLNCEDYDKVNGICMSNGGCAPERRTDGQG